MERQVLVCTSVSQDAHRQHPLGEAIERKHGPSHRDFYRSVGRWTDGEAAYVLRRHRFPVPLFLVS